MYPTRSSLKGSTDKGLSTLVSFALLLTILTAAYTYYQVFGVPKFCEQYEIRTFTRTLMDLQKVGATLRSIEISGRGRDVFIDLGGSYPTIPFFTTPTQFSGTIYTYPAEIRILNAVAVNPELRSIWNGDPVVWSGSSLAYEPSTYYYKPGSIRIEYGVVAFGKNSFASLSGKIIEGKNINILMFNGNLSYSGYGYDLPLYPYSGGGTGITITDNGKPIQIQLKTRLPLQFWRSYFSQNPYVASVSREGDFVTVTLVKGVKYLLNVGIASFDGSKADACYLYRTSPKVLTPPSQISVEVRDIYSNPVSGKTVRFFSVNDKALLTNGTYTGYYVTAKSRMGVASVVVKSTTGNDIVIAEIERKDGTTYDLSFVIVG